MSRSISGLLAALAWALDQGHQDCTSDPTRSCSSEQFKGEYRVKNPGLQPLYQEARELVGRSAGDVRARAPRAQQEADRLANLAMDEAARPIGQ